MKRSMMLVTGRFLFFAVSFIALNIESTVGLNLPSNPIEDAGFMHSAALFIFDIEMKQHMI